MQCEIREASVVNISMFCLHVYSPSFIIIICLSAIESEFLIKDLQYEGAPKYLGESVTGMKMGSEMKQWHSKLLV